MNLNTFALNALWAAKDTPTEILEKVKNLLKGGVGFLGAFLIVLGAINLGMSLKDGAQGGGGQLAGAIAMIVGGAVIVAASVFFGTLDTGWLNA